MLSSSDVERIVKRMLGSLSATIVAQQDGTGISDGHRVLNFQGSGVTVSDDAASRRTNINIPGAPTATSTTTILSTAGAGSKAISLWNSGTVSNDAPPANWQTTGFSDSGWANGINNTEAATYSAIIPGASHLWASATGTNTAEIDLVRQRFTLPAGTISGAILTILCDSQMLGCYINNTLVGSHPDTPWGSAPGSPSTAYTFTISPSLLVAGSATNLIAVEAQNNLDPTVGGSVIFKLVVTYSSAGTDPQYELVAHKGAASGYAELDAGGLVPTDDLGTGTASSTTFLRGDQTWAPASTNSVAVQEVDGTPNVAAVTIEFPNGTLTDHGGGVVEYVPAGASGNKLILNFQAATDIASAVTLTTSAWTDVIPNQSFTVDDATAVIEFDLSGFIEITAGGSASCLIGTRLVVDSAGTPVNLRLGGAHPRAGEWENALSGGGQAAISAGLSVATHTVKLQVWTDQAATANCKCSTNPNQHAFGLRVWQRK